MNQKKVLSFFVAVIMAFSIISVEVFANTAENTTVTDIYEIISSGIDSSEKYIQEQLIAAHNGDGVTYGYEWYIIAMLRAGKTIDAEILDEYCASLSEKVKTWDSDVKPTDAERVALALLVMGKDITDVDGVNLAELIYNNSRLADGSNELAYALILLDAAKTQIPDDAIWQREEIIDGILSFQTEDGAFGLSDNVEPDIDMTAICLQALASYQDKENVKEATDKAFIFLKGIMTGDFSFAGNVNSIAQTLMASAIFKIDITNPENGFGNAENNIITAIEKYRNPAGNGYMYEDRVSSMATFQVMQAYDAYRKAHKEDVLYWDFIEKSGGNDEDDGEDVVPPTKPEVDPAEPVNVYVTIASDGNIVKDKNCVYVAQVPVKVNDIDEDGKLTVDEALYETHEAFYEGGAETGYSTFTGTYGLSLETLWGKGTPGESAVAGYWLNNASCWSLYDEVKEGDYLVAFNYYDTKSWSDIYSFFEKNEVSAKSGSSVSLTLNAIGYDENWNTVSKPYQGAKVKLLGSENTDAVITDESGKAEISLDGVSAGSYYAVAYSDDFLIVPAVCKIDVAKNAVAPRPSSSGGGGSKGKVEVKNEEEEITDATDEKLEEDIDEKTEENRAFTEKTFSDVKKDDWYYDSVKYVYENSLMQGTESGFAPDGKMSRAMLVTVLYRIANPTQTSVEHGFNDVPEGQWYSDSVAWAKENGIVTGVTETEFMPDSYVSREQMAVVIYRFAKTEGYEIQESEELSSFSDYDEISDWALDALSWAKSEKLLTGTSDTTLSPKSVSTRAQVATILMRFCETLKTEK